MDLLQIVYFVERITRRVLVDRSAKTTTYKLNIKSCRMYRRRRRIGRGRCGSCRTAMSGTLRAAMPCKSSILPICRASAHPTYSSRNECKPFVETFYLSTASPVRANAVWCEIGRIASVIRYLLLLLETCVDPRHSRSRRQLATGGRYPPENPTVLRRFAIGLIKSRTKPSIASTIQRSARNVRLVFDSLCT